MDLSVQENIKPAYTIARIQNLKRSRAGFGNGMVLSPASTANAYRTHNVSIPLQGDATGEDHDLAVIGGVNAEELSAGLWNFGEAQLVENHRVCSKLLKRHRPSSDISQLSIHRKHMLPNELRQKSLRGAIWCNSCSLEDGNPNAARRRA
jgi:hypothetical protein